MAYTRTMNGKVPQVLQELHFDETPTPGSLNPVTSGGVAETQGATDEKLAELAELFFLNTKNIEVPSKKAKVGYALYADSDGNKHFICDKSLDAASIPADWEYVGPVILREGDKATILYKTENTSVKWASMWLFKVNGLKLDGTDTFVLQQGPATGSVPVEIGTFTATAAATDLDTLVDELDEWLRENNTAEGALANYNWHAEKHADADGIDSCFIVVDNFINQALGNNNNFSPIKSSTSGASAPMYMWDWVGFNSDSNFIKRKDGVNTLSVAWNKNRVKQYNTNIGSVSDSLTSAGIYSEAGFNATTVLKSYYGTYDNYLDHMVPDEEATTGAYALFKGKGKEVAETIHDIVFPNLSGTDTTVFPAEAWAASLKAHSTASVEGLNEGAFIIPSIDVAYKILSTMNTDGSDTINSSLVKANLSKLDLDKNRHIPARYINVGEWQTSSSGAFNISGMYSGLRAIAVAEIDL